MKRLGLAVAAWLAKGLAAGLAAGAAAAAPLVGPWPGEETTEVAVLGSPHLSGIEHLRPEWTAPLLDRLAAWKPRVIAIEGLSGPECYLVRAFARSWPGTADSYCAGVERIAALGAKATGLDMPAAEAEAERAVARLGPQSRPAERRRMAALFAAAGNVGSAAVQWLRLAPAERRAGDGVSEELAARSPSSPSAATRITGSRPRLPRVSGWNGCTRPTTISPTGCRRKRRRGWKRRWARSGAAPRPALASQAAAMEKAVGGGEALLAYYRFLNRAEVGEAFVRADMGRAHATPSAGRHGRRYVAWWEARNLRMVANIRQALGREPGARALVVVGNTHKPYFDAYLGMMHEVRVVPVQRLIGR
jgi:hypothetical protein